MLTLAISLKASGATFIFSFSQMRFSLETTDDWDRRWKSKRWHRDMMVDRTLCGSVVASMNMAWGGGSSSVLRKALDASLVIIWTSSMM